MHDMASPVEPLRPMPRDSTAPSARLLRAVAAEQGDLERRRQALLDRRRRVQQELDEIGGAVAELDERLELISRLVGEASPRRRSSDDKATAEASDHGSRPVLRGPAIRAAAVRVLLGHPRQPEALHYRDWFDLLAQSGYAVAGKDPLAVFLTQLSRSPLVRRGTQSGVYELELQAPTHLRRQLDDLQAQLRDLTATASRSTTDLGTLRRRRTALNAAISKVEKALEEAEETLRNPPETPGLAAAS
jgi:chaperonin cofactor prefoldin